MRVAVVCILLIAGCVDEDPPPAPDPEPEVREASATGPCAYLEDVTEPNQVLVRMQYDDNLNDPPPYSDFNSRLRDHNRDTLAETTPHADGCIAHTPTEPGEYIIYASEGDTWSAKSGFFQFSGGLVELDDIIVHAAVS